MVSYFRTVGYRVSRSSDAVLSSPSLPFRMSASTDAVIWQSIGHDLIQTIVAVTVETFLIAVYSVLVAKTTCLLLVRHRTRASLYTCCSVLVMFVLAIALWIIDVHNLVTEVKMTLLSTSGDALSDDYAAAVSSILRLASVEDTLYSYMTIIGDGIIIWRVYAFWCNGRDRYALLIPLAFLLGSITTSVMLTYCGARLGADIELGTYQHPAFCRNIQTASYSMTLVTTTVATILITLKTWQYRRTYLAAFGTLGPRTRTLGVMIMLIESGVLYMLFFASQIIISVGSVNARIEQNATLTFASTIEEYISSLIVGLYPTVVVILVHSKHSVLKSKTETSSGALVFRARPELSEASGTTDLSTNAPIFVDKAASVPSGDAGLYELAEVKPGNGVDVESSLKVKVQRSVVYSA